MKQIIKGIKIISILFLTLTFFVGCEDDDDNQLPVIEAGFTHTINQVTGTVTFINTSSNADAYSWDFGDDTTSTEINPIHTYESGTYTIVLEADNAAGASDTFEDTITIQGTVNTGGDCTAETTESIAAADLNITFQTNTPAVIEDNAAFSWIDNPDSEGAVNTSCKVGQVVRANNSAFDNIQIDLSDKLDFSTSDGLKMKVWSPIANTPVLIKLEEIGNSGNFVEIQQSTTTANSWEELTFDFAATATPQFDKMVIFFNFNVADGSTYYFDDLALYGTGGGGPACTAETSESIAAADLNITFQSNTPTFIEDNTSFAWIDNPDAAGSVNTSCKVGEATRANNSAFDNLQIDLADKLDFNSVEGLKIKVWSPIANTPVLLKLEEIGNAGNFVEILQNTTAANTWEELTFDFAPTATPQYNKIVIFFNFNVADGSTYYFDDLAVYGAGGGGSTCVPETTESIAAADLNITFQTNTPAVIEDNAAFSWIDNPDFGGSVNSSCKVGEVVRANNSAFDNVQIDLSDKLDFNASEGLKLKVWSPIANTPVLLKLEEIGNAGNFVEILQNTGAANTWTELTYDFAPTATPQFNKMVIFFNFNVADASTYYFDDLALYGTGGGGGGGGGGTCPAPPAGEFIADGGFESNGDCWQLIDNGGTVTISTTVNNGGSNSGQIKTTPGSNPALKQERFGIGTMSPNTTYVVQFDIQANASDMPANGAVFQAFAFSEPAEGSPDPAVQHILIQGDANFPTTWQTRTYTFTTAGNIDGGVSLLLELVCGGVAGCTGTINIDNVSITAQ
jgi:PKD repeat protein